MDVPPRIRDGETRTGRQDNGYKDKRELVLPKEFIFLIEVWFSNILASSVWLWMVRGRGGGSERDRNRF